MGRRPGKQSKHNRHPVQHDPLHKLTEEQIQQYRNDFLAMEQHLQLLCWQTKDRPIPILERVEPLEFYRDLFPAGSFETMEDTITRKPNGLVTVVDDKEKRGWSYNRIIFDDLEEIEANMDKEFVLVAPIGYSGRKRISRRAYTFYGMIIDLDDVGIDQLEDLIYQMQNGVLPMASYLVHTASGFHVCYFFDTPVPALPEYFESLTRLKADLSNMIWNQYTSRDKNKQFQGIFQAFRMVGSPTKLGDAYRYTAFRLGEKVSIRYLNDFADKENRCIFDDIKHVSLDEAHEKWEDWYVRRICQGKAVGEYDLTEKEKIRRRAWYEAWKERIKKGAYDGNRHYCIGVLFNYAMKAEIPLDEALEDALGMVDDLNTLTKKENNPFTENDVYDAMIYYDRQFIKMGRDGIKRLTKIDIGETKRNGRKQSVHLGRARALQKFDDPNGDWRNKDGAPTKEQIVQDWRKDHPAGKKADCIRETGIDKKTVYKWWDSENKQD